MENTYAKRWKIETLLKKLKQNFNLSSFLSQSRNGSMIQKWVILITFLLLEITHLKIDRRIAFTVMFTDLRILIMTYVEFLSFLNNPNKAKGIKKKELETSKIPPMPPVKVPVRRDVKQHRKRRGAYF